MSQDKQLHDTTSNPIEQDLPDNLAPEVAEQLGRKHPDARIGTAQGSVVNKEQTEVVTIEGVEDGEAVVYWFEMRDITWGKKNRIFKDNVQQVGGQGQLQIDTYYREVAEAKIVSWFGEDDMSLTQWLTGVGAEVGEKLEPHLPDPVNQLEEQEEGN